LDLRQYFRVIWRFRFIVAAGLILAVVLSLLSYVKATFKGGKPSVAYRQSETWESSTIVAVTQPGFPEGRSVFAYTRNPGSTTQPLSTNFADPGRYSQLAVSYSRLANSDQVRALVPRRALRRGVYQATPVVDPRFPTVPLGFVQFNGFGSDPRSAIVIANAGAQAFRKYLSDRQDASGIPTDQRIALPVINRVTGLNLYQGRRKTTPIVIFLMVAISAIALAFILENLRPRVRLVEKEVEDLQVARGGRGA
jgi:hypothetical protein